MDSIYDLIIVGGGPAGLSAAIYAGRSERQTLLLEKEATADESTIPTRSATIRAPLWTAAST